MIGQVDMFKAPPSVVDIAYANGDLFAADFLEWLPENLNVWHAFVEETFKVIRRGFKHYSSYTIVEFLRHHTAVHEASPVYKINNNHRPYLPRLFGLIYPQHAGLFEYRTTTKEKGKKQRLILNKPSVMQLVCVGDNAPDESPKLLDALITLEGKWLAKSAAIYDLAESFSWEIDATEKAHINEPEAIARMRARFENHFRVRDGFQDNEFRRNEKGHYVYVAVAQLWTGWRANEEWRDAATNKCIAEQNIAASYIGENELRALGVGCRRRAGIAAKWLHRLLHGAERRGA